MTICTLGLRLAVVLSLALHISVALAASPFAGDWSGPWRDEHGQSGVFSLHVDDAGAVSGQVTNTTVTGAGKVWGRIGDAGDLVASYRYQFIVYRMTARLALRGDHLGGTAHYALPPSLPIDSGPVDLTRQ